MPLRDHFHTTSSLLHWERLHAYWPASIVRRLNQLLPAEYFASPRIHLGSSMELDVAAWERESPPDDPANHGGGVATVYAPTAPAILIDTDLPDPAEYEVNVYTQDEFRLVATIELISPSNKDRPESRRTFVNKCETLLKNDVCVIVVDVVTNRHANLYAELLDEVNAQRTATTESLIYAVSARGQRHGTRWRLEAWEHELAIGLALPTLPLWLTATRAVPLELEMTYEDSCRELRIR